LKWKDDLEYYDVVGGGIEMILVPLEKIGSVPFRNFVEMLKRADSLARIFIDEVHFLVLEELFRAAITDVLWLREFDAQIVMTTATLSDEDVIVVQSKLGLECLRRITSDDFGRPELKISRRFLGKQTREEFENIFVTSIVTPGMISSLLRTSKRKILIYTEYVETLEFLYYAMWKAYPECKPHMFHGRLTTEEKDVVYAQIMEDSCRIILGTRALGQGLNLGDIVFIVLVGPDSCLETYIQKAGRGGRTGLGCEILSVFEDNNTQNFIGHFEKNLQKITSERVKQRVKRRFNQFRLLMNPEKLMCVRRIWGLVTGSKFDTCLNAGYEKCDACLRTLEISSIGMLPRQVSGDSINYLESPSVTYIASEARRSNVHNNLGVMPPPTNVAPPYSRNRCATSNVRDPSAPNDTPRPDVSSTIPVSTPRRVGSLYECRTPAGIGNYHFLDSIRTTASDCYSSSSQPITQAPDDLSSQFDDVFDEYDRSLSHESDVMSRGGKVTINDLAPCTGGSGQSSSSSRPLVRQRDPDEENDLQNRSAGSKPKDLKYAKRGELDSSSSSMDSQLVANGNRRSHHEAKANLSVVFAQSSTPSQSPIVESSTSLSYNLQVGHEVQEAIRVLKSSCAFCTLTTGAMTDSCLRGNSDPSKKNCNIKGLCFSCHSTWNDAEHIAYRSKSGGKYGCPYKFNTNAAWEDFDKPNGMKFCSGCGLPALPYYNEIRFHAGRDNNIGGNSCNSGGKDCMYEYAFKAFHVEAVRRPMFAYFNIAHISTLRDYVDWMKQSTYNLLNFTLVIRWIHKHHIPNCSMRPSSQMRPYRR
jgi:hypothetical protein